MLALMTSPDTVDYETKPLPRRDVTRVPSSLAGPFPPSPVQTLEPREDLFLEGDDATHIFEMIKGIVCAYRILPDGERHIVSFYFPGDVLGYCSPEVYAFSAQALTPASVRRVSRAALERSMQRGPDVARKLLYMAAIELSATRDHLVCLAAKSAEAKTASFLIALSRRNAAAGEDPMQIRLPMTRLDIADYLGLTLETVSRMLNKFKRQGLIDLPRATLVQIKDARKLAALADG